MTSLATSRRMSAVRQRDTEPEMCVRRLVHGMGFRYRLHVRSLPGCPDLVFRSRKKVILVHGCFWHRHGCARSTVPKTRRTYWMRKFQRNQLRDRATTEVLHAEGWQVMIVWECETKQAGGLRSELRAFLEA